MTDIERLKSLSNVVKCEPYSCLITYQACAERHAESYASHHVTSKKRHVGKLALCFGCIEGRDRMQALGMVPVERVVRGVKLVRGGSMERLPPR
jgi:hypothetical protein